MLRCADGVWTVCWFDVIAQMVVAPMPMLHLNGGPFAATIQLSEWLGCIDFIWQVGTAPAQLQAKFRIRCVPILPPWTKRLGLKNTMPSL